MWEACSQCCSMRLTSLQNNWDIADILHSQAERGVRSGFILRTCDNLGLVTVRAIRPLGKQLLGAHKFHSYEPTSLDTNNRRTEPTGGGSHIREERNTTCIICFCYIQRCIHPEWLKRCALMILKNTSQCKWMIGSKAY